MTPARGNTGTSPLTPGSLLPRIKSLAVDDWSGVTSAAERRRRQNRLNQRAWRQKARQRKAQSSETQVGTSFADSGSQDHPPRQNALDGAPRDAGPLNDAFVQAEGYLLLPSHERRMKAQEFTLRFRRYHSDGIAQLACLPCLTRLNVLDAMARNAAAMGFSIKGLCRDDLISPFNQTGPRTPWSGGILASCPVTLLPTPTQRAVIHHPWIDLIPIPQFRDNILRAMHAGLIEDDDELCADLLRFDGNHTDNAAIVVWADSWDIRGWEASLPFLRKWGWLIKDCFELFLATNEWRERRGEKRLSFQS